MSSGYCKYYKENEEVSYDGGITWDETQNFRKGALYESYSHDCGYLPTEYRWVTVPGGYECSGTTKMTQQKKQVSHDSGTTWEDVVPLETMATYPVIEYRSTDCGYIPPGPCDPIYQWNDVGYCCFDWDRYIVEKSQVSYDCGETWEDVPSVKERLRLDSYMTCDCGYESPSVIGSTGYTYLSEYDRQKWQIFCQEGYGTMGSYVAEVKGDDGIWEDGGMYGSYGAYFNCDCVGGNPEPLYTRLDKVVYPYTLDFISIPQLTVNNYTWFKKAVILSNIPPILRGSSIDWDRENEFAPIDIGFPTYFLQEFSPFNYWFKDTEYQSPTQYDYIPISVDEIYVPSASYEDYKADDRWTKNAPPTSSINPYLWTFIRVKYDYEGRHRITNEYFTATTYSNFDCQMLFAKGVGISSIVDYYIISSSQPSSSDTGWTTNVQSILPITDFVGLWNYKVITYNDNTVITTEPKMIDFLNHSYGIRPIKIIDIAYYYKASPHASGVTPTDYSWYQYGDKIKAIPCAQPNSIPLYRWVVNSSSYECAGATKITQEKQQVSYDSGSTWSDVSPLNTRIGHEVIEYNSTDCGYTPFNGKYKLILGNGTIISAACDSTSAITQEEVIDYKDSAVSLVIGNCVTRIDYDAFNHFTSLTSLTIGNNVTYIGNYSFAACRGLTSLVIPDTVTEIGQYAFSDCWNLESVILGSSLTLLWTNSFRNCYNLKNMTLRSTTPPNIWGGVDTSDVYHIFKNVDFEGIYVPCNSLETYKEAYGWANYVFENKIIPYGACTYYRWVTVPNGYECSGTTKMSQEKKQASYDSGTTWSDVTPLEIRAALPVIEYNSYDCAVNEKYTFVLSNGKIVSADCDSSSAITQGEISSYSATCVNAAIGYCVDSIGSKAFRVFKNLTSIRLLDSITSIGIEAFANCGSLTSITIPSGVTSIEGYTFAQCSAMTSCTISSGVTNIGEYAFTGCTSLLSLTIPSGVTNIGEGAFKYCWSLNSVTIEATTPPTLGWYAFSNTNDCPIYVPSGSVNAYKAATNWSTYASRIQAIP